VPIHRLLKDELEEAIERVRLAGTRLRGFEGAIALPRDPFGRLTLDTFTEPVPGVARELEEAGWTVVTNAVAALARRT
jgi:hypothetical protein